VTQKSITEMEHPPYSSDFAPNDCWLFIEIKSTLKGRRFEDTEDFQKKKKNVTTVLKVFHNRSCKNVSNGGSVFGLSA
jgi:hypothetical protein